jgi:hypothetical protein
VNRRPTPSTACPTSQSVHGVIAGLVLDDESGRVLVGVRDIERNVRHPGVISIPTMRVPLALARELCGERVPDATEQAVEVSGPVRPVGGHGSTIALEGLLVEALLTKKLGLGDALVSGAVRGHCSVRLAMFDRVDDPTGRDGREEVTMMVTLGVTLSGVRRFLPARTASYSDFAWVPCEELTQAWHGRCAQQLFPYANPFEICIRGLCIRSAVHLIELPSRDLALLGEASGD